MHIANVLQMNNDDKAIYPICKNKLKEHSIVQFRPFFGKEGEEV
jgi:hypothetical protein